MTWRNTLLLALAVLGVRALYLVLLCRYELLGDEAYYWEWSRRLGLCYYEKGPGIAYLIAASTSLLGVSEWAVRLPMAIASALATLVLARLAMACSGGDERVGFLAALVFTLIPAYQGNAQICTQDGPFIACWILSSWAAWRLFVRIERDRKAALEWIILGATLGLGFLFKQSMLLLVPGLMLNALLRRRHMRWAGKLATDALLGLIAFLAIISPVLIWNYQHQWPTLAHTLGHLGAPGGDLATRTSKPQPYDPLWTLGLIVAQFVALGPPVVILMVQALRWSIRARRQPTGHWPAQLLMICCAAPSLALYTLMTFWKRAEANWPFPAFATLIVPVAQLLAAEWMYCGQGAAEKAPGACPTEPPSAMPRRPWHTLPRGAWKGVLVYGVAAWLLISFLPNVFPGVEWVGKDRVFGRRVKATRMEALIREAAARTGQTPFLVTPHYMEAALYAFYLPGHPPVYNAGSFMGGRESSYDFWADTDLSAGALRGKPALLIGGLRERWEQALCFDSLSPLDENLPAWLGGGYCGPTAARNYLGR